MKTKEERLEEAKRITDEATSLLNEWGLLKNKMQKFTGHSKLKPTALIDAVSDRQRSFSNTQYSIRREEEMEQEKSKKEQAEKDAKERVEKEKVYLQDAINYCIENGKVLGTDFTLSNAIGTANNIAFEKEKVKRIHEMHGDHISFNGQNCDDCLDDGEECSGWDGVSHRCSCGNRRVDWEMDGDFKNMYIYGEAY